MKFASVYIIQVVKLQSYKPIHINGKYVYLTEIEPKYFPYVIEWRNNPNNNRFLNQPFVLTMEKQKAWYERYTKDNTQGMMIMVAKDGDIPFATLGWTDYIADEKILISGRALVGNKNYAGSKELMEGFLLLNDYLYEKYDIQTMYIHVVNENKKVISFNKKWGYKPHLDNIKFPSELLVNCMHQTEYMRSKNDYEIARKKIINILNILE